MASFWKKFTEILTFSPIKEYQKPAEAVKKAQKVAAFEQNEERRKADERTAEIDIQAKERRKRRRADISRNKTRVSDPFGFSMAGQAETVRKTLTGE